MKTATLLVLSATVAASALAPSVALAQPAEGIFPARPLRFLVPFAPGGGNDFIAKPFPFLEMSLKSLIYVLRLKYPNATPVGAI